MRRKTPEDQRAALGATHEAGTASCRAPLGPRGGTRPCSWWVPSAPSDAYKIPKTEGAAIIFQRSHPDVPSPETLVRG